MSGLTFNRPNYRKAEREAQRLLDDFYVAAPPVDPVSIAKGLGVNVFFATFTGKSREISGFFDCDENAIYINEEEWPLRQTFTLAHELGHKILHEDWAKSEEYKVMWRDPVNQVRDFREQEADAFAANLLMPRELMDKYYQSLNPSQLSQLFAVSVPAIKMRLSFLYGI